MKKGAVIAIVVGTLLLIGGGVVLGIGISKGVQEAKGVTNEHEIANFSNVNIDISTATLEFKVSEDGASKVVCEERENYYHTVNVENDTLIIKSVNNKKWYESLFQFSYSPMKVTVYYPASDLGNGVIEASTGNIYIPHDYSFESLSVKASTGNVHVKSDVSTTLNVETSTGNSYIEVNAKNLNVKASTGNIYLTNTIVEENMYAKLSTGNIHITDSDAQNIDLDASTGNIHAVLLSGKKFEVTTKTGKAHYPASIEGNGTCKVHTSTGNVDITIKE